MNTETTGLVPRLGKYMIDIGCTEIEDSAPPGGNSHVCLDPERGTSYDVEAMVGLTNDELCGLPHFADVVEQSLGFIEGFELLIHNALFDLAFLDCELERCGKAKMTGAYNVIDTLLMERRLHPGVSNTLNAL
jgi:DNA polymerase-3 subunit epsilon